MLSRAAPGQGTYSRSTVSRAPLTRFRIEWVVEDWTEKGKMAGLSR